MVENSPQRALNRRSVALSPTAHSDFLVPCDAGTPLANCTSAKARNTALTWCTPLLNSFLNSLWSLVLTSMRRAGRAIPEYEPKHFGLELFY